MVERVLWAEKYSVCKNWEGAAANCFARSEDFAALCQTQAQAQERSEIPRKSISWDPHRSASSTHTELFLLPRTRALLASHAVRLCVSDGNVQARGPLVTPSTKPPWQLPSLPLEPAPPPGNL